MLGGRTAERCLSPAFWGSRGADTGWGEGSEGEGGGAVLSRCRGALLIASRGWPSALARQGAREASTV